MLPREGRIEFDALRDQLAHNTRLLYENKPITQAAWKGITRAVEFSRQCRSLHDFDCKWSKRVTQGLGLMDAWSIFASDQTRPHPQAEADAVSRIYNGLLYAVGVNRDYTQEQQEFFSLSISEVVIRKAKLNVRP